MLGNFASGRLRAAFLKLAVLAMGVGALAATAGPAAAQNMAGITLDKATPNSWNVPLGGLVTGRVDYKNVNVLPVFFSSWVLIGLRDGNLDWVGSDPLLLTVEFLLPNTYVQHTNEIYTLVAPVVAGNYKVWLYATSAPDLATAVTEFKNPLLAGNGACSVAAGNVTVGTPGPTTKANITVDLSSVTGMPWLAGNDISGTFSFTMWAGDLPTQNCIVTVGLRDTSGNWVPTSLDPVVVQNVAPPRGAPGQLYTNNKITNVPTPAGALSFVWVHLSEGQTDPLVAIQDFKSTVVTAESPLDRIVGIVIGPANGLNIYQQNPAGWVLKAPGGKPVPLSCGMTVQMQLPAGQFISKPYIVVVGVRNDTTGKWVGGEPLVVATDSPVWDLPHVFIHRGFAGLVPPVTGAGPFSVWARMVQTTSTKSAIKDFKNSIVMAGNDTNVRIGALVIPSAGVTVSNPKPTAWTCPRQVQPWVTGSVDVHMWNGPDQTKVQKVVVGIRDVVTGAWVGGAPQVILTDAPPSDLLGNLTGKTYNARQFYKISTLKLAPGTYALWVRLVQTTNNAAAIKAFKVIFPVPDPLLDGGVGVVTVP